MQKRKLLVMLCVVVATGEVAAKDAQEKKLSAAVTASPVKSGQTWVLTQKLPKAKPYRVEIELKNVRTKLNRYGALELTQRNASIYYSAKDNSMSIIDVTIAEKDLDNPLHICVGQFDNGVAKGVSFGVPYMKMGSQIGEMNEKRLHNPKLFKSYLKSKKLTYGTCTIQLKK